MTTTTSTSIHASVRQPWIAFVKLIEEHREDLFAFGRRLTGNAFDGEDLVQEAIIRAFGVAAANDDPIDDLRPYLFRTMANLWIDQQRRPRTEPLDRHHEAATHDGDSSDVREAATVLFDLPPKERAAVVLHDAFGFRHAEVADMLSTTDGAVRSALHRAKGRLGSGAPATDETAPAVDRVVLDRFVDAFFAADVDAIRDLLLDGVRATVFPYAGHGADAVATRWVNGCLYHHDADRESRGEPFPTELRATRVDGRLVLVVWRGGSGGMLLEEVWRFETADGHIAAIHDYCFSPGLIGFVGETLGESVRLLGVTADDVLDAPG